MDGYVNSFKEPKYMSLLIKNDQQAKKCCETWDRISNIMEKGFDRQLVG